MVRHGLHLDGSTLIVPNKLLRVLRDVLQEDPLCVLSPKQSEADPLPIPCVALLAFLEVGSMLALLQV